jgi:hypothetical protein
MSDARRLITSIDIDETAGPEFNNDHRLSISALHELELAGGRRLTLLDDRGWSASGPSGIWSYESVETLTQTARTVVGPDEPLEGRSYEEEAALHWAYRAGGAHRGRRAGGASPRRGHQRPDPSTADRRPEPRLILRSCRCPP